MGRNNARLGSVRQFVACAAFAFVCGALAGCGGNQVDKYTVTDADRKAGQATLGADGKPLAGGTGSIPKDIHDGAAYGPDGKPMGK